MYPHTGIILFSFRDIAEWQIISIICRTTTSLIWDYKFKLAILREHLEFMGKFS